MYLPIEGGTCLNIQGIDCWIPPEGYVWNILTKQLEFRGVYKRSEIPTEQYWERMQPPIWYKDTMKRWEMYDKKKKDDDPPFFDEELEKFKTQEWDRRLNGFWFMNYNPAKGVSEAIYLPGIYYMMLQWWPIDVDKVKFTNPHLNAFYFMVCCIEDPRCFGMIEITKRRFLKTFKGGIFLVDYVTRTKMTNAGIQSKTGKDAKKLFGKAVVQPFKRLPRFFRPEYDMSLGVTPKTEMRFQQTNVRGKKAEENIDKDELGSMIDFEDADAIAYDGQKLHRYFRDEWAKTDATNVYDSHEVVRYCLLDEEGNIIGKALYSSTVEKLETDKEGVQEAARQLWDASDQNRRNDRGQTESGLYRFFQTADESKNIDIYGHPNVEKTIKEILADWESVKSKPKVLAARKRKEPRTIDDAFIEDSDTSIFNTVNIDERKKQLRENPISLRKIIFFRELDQTIKWRDVIQTDGDFYWEVSPDFDLNPQQDSYGYDGKIRFPKNTNSGIISVDSYSNSQGGRKYGSRASALYGDKKLFKVTAHLYGRPKEKAELHNQVMLCSEFRGVQSLYEHSADDYVAYFRERGRIRYLAKYPLSLIDPVKIKQAGEMGPERFYGSPITPYSLTKQHDNGVAYFEHHCHLIDFMDILEKAPKFDPYNRTESDIIVSFLINISALMEPIIQKPKATQSFIKTYDNPLYRANANNY